MEVGLIKMREKLGFTQFPLSPTSDDYLPPPPPRVAHSFELSKKCVFKQIFLLEIKKKETHRR